MSLGTAELSLEELFEQAPDGTHHYSCSACQPQDGVWAVMLCEKRLHPEMGVPDGEDLPGEWCEACVNCWVCPRCGMQY